MTSRRQSSQLLLFLYLLTSLMVNARPFNEQDDVEMVAPFNSDASEIADTAACPAECTCSTGALSDLVVQCRSYQGLQANSLLPRLANQMEGFVTRLDIDGSQIPVLIEDFLNNDRGYVKSLRSLRLTNSGVKKISTLAFKSAKLLEEIELSSNDLFRLPNDIFSSSTLPNLRMVSLRDNKQLNFPKNIPFLKSHSIEELDLSSCGITAIHSHSLTKIPKLVYLNLADNLIENIDPEAFSKLNYLEELDLSGNVIVNIPSKLPPTLQVLSLRNNPQFNVNSLITLAPNLEINDLDISQCNIATLPRNAFNRLYDLTSLNLSHNALTNLHFPLVLRKLQNLDLSHNRLSGTLNANLLGSCNELETLRLSWNQGLRLPDDGLQGDLSKLYLFDMSGCELPALPPSAIAPFTGLTHLNLSNNALATLAKETFKPFSHLSVLDLSVNLLNYLPGSIFQDNNKLRQLSIASNPSLGPVLNDKILEYKNFLIYLDIARCEFKDVPETLPEGIETLVMSNNKMRDPTRLNKLIETSLLELSTIEMTNNPWDCNFEFKQFIAMLRERQIIDTSYNNSWSFYQSDVCTKRILDEIYINNMHSRPREIARSHFWSLVTFSVTLMVFLVIAVGVTVSSCRRRLSPGVLSRDYRQLSESSNINSSQGLNTKVPNNKVYNETTEPVVLVHEANNNKPTTATTFTNSYLFPRFPLVTESEIPTTYVSGNYHHGNLVP